MKKFIVMTFALLLCAVQEGRAQHTVSTESGLQAAVDNNEDDITLVADITLTTTLTVKEGKTATIDLCGHTLSRGLGGSSTSGGKGHVIEVQRNATLKLTDTEGGGCVTGGHADCGGAIYNRGAVIIENVCITGNKASVNGGAICNRGVMTINNGTTISGNESPDGGAIYNEKDGGNGYIGELTITGGSITGNTSTQHGGGGITNKGTLTMTGGSVTGNTCAGRGGGIYSHGTINLQGAVIVYGNTPNNLYLAGNDIINIQGALAEGASIGVSQENYDEPFTTGYGKFNGYTGMDKYFHSDANSSTVENRGGEAKVVFLVTDGVPYVQGYWDEIGKTVVNVEEKAASPVSLNGQTTLSGWYYSDHDNTYSARRITISGNTHLILKDGTTLTCEKGIYIKDGIRLYIHGQSKGTGRLRCTGGGDDNAAIGGNDGDIAGHLVIYGGNIYAAADHNNAAGIGGGNKTSGIRSVTIYGGNVEAHGKDSGAGIGKGQQNDVWETVTIYGGTVTATGGSAAAGIGGGEDRGNGPVTIYGGTVTATGGYSNLGNIFGTDGGAGIGGGAVGDQDYPINIYGGTVTATGGTRAAGIGGGPGGDGGIINIHGGEVTAIGGDGAACIGGGYIGEGGDVTITGGIVNVKATGFILIGSGAAGPSDPPYLPDNSLSLADNMMVIDGSGKSVPANERESTCRMCDHKGTKVTIEPCTHKDSSYTVIDNWTHRLDCNYCKVSSDIHTYDAYTGYCVCGHSIGTRTYTFYQAVEGGTNGEYDEGTTYTRAADYPFALPDCTAFPYLMEFAGWMEGTPSTVSGYATGDNEIIHPVGDLTPGGAVDFVARYRHKPVIFDVNHDGLVNVADVTCLADHLLGMPLPGESYLECPDNHHPHLIDLGLPSRTSWSCCNVGAGTPESSGMYVAWGETKEKVMYDWGSYDHCDGTEDGCLDLGTDIAGTEYDAAFVNQGSEWQTPTLDQGKELLENCTIERKTLKGVSGRLFTGPNGGKVFLPSTGYRQFSDTYYENLEGHYWLSTAAQFPNKAMCLMFYTKSTSCENDYRDIGLGIRPVYATPTISYHFDVNLDGLDSVTDVTTLVNYILKGEE